MYLEDAKNYVNNVSIGKVWIPHFAKCTFGEEFQLKGENHRNLVILQDPEDRNAVILKYEMLVDAMLIECKAADYMESLNDFCREVLPKDFPYVLTLPEK